MMSSEAAFELRLSSTAPSSAPVIWTAITAVLQEQGSPLSATAYFGALMSTLEQHAARITADAVDTVNTAHLNGVIYLLSLVMQREALPRAVLVSKHAEIATVFLDVLQKCPEEASIAKRVLVCISCVATQLDASLWTSRAATRMLQAMLVFTVDPRPKLRRIAQSGVVGVITALSSSSTAVPRPVLDSVLRSCDRELQSCSSSDPTLALHLCGLLKSILPLLPLATAATLLDRLFKLAASSGKPMIALKAMQCAAAVFASTTQSTDVSFLVALIDAVMGMRPHTSDADAWHAYANAMVCGFDRLHREDRALCATKLPPFFATLLDGLLSPKDAVVSSVAKAMKSLWASCVLPPAANATEIPAGTPLHSIMATTLALLSYRYKERWSVVLPVLGEAFRVLSTGSIALVTNMLTTLAELVDADDTIVSGSERTAARKVISVAIEVYGAGPVVSVVPLRLPCNKNVALDVELTASRTWLLRLLKENARGSSLASFVRHLMQPAEALRVRLQGLVDRPVEQRALSAVLTQVWEAFPAFCSAPDDVATTWPSMLPTLASMLANTDEIVESARTAAARGISTLVHRFPTSAAVAASTSSLLPPVFAAAASCDATKRQQLLELSSALAALAPADLVNRLFKSVLKQLLQAKESSQAEAMMELAVALVAHLDEQNRQWLERALAPALGNGASSSGLQKKAYRALTALLQHHGAAMHPRVESVIESLLASLPSLASSSRRARLRCITAICQVLQEEQRREQVPKLLGEAILSLKDSNGRTREAGYEALEKMATAFETSAALQEFMMMILGGLAGSPHMQSATVLALSRLLYCWRTRLEASATGMIGQLLETVLMLFQEKSIEVVRSVLGFVKVAVAVLQADSLRPHLEAIVSGLMRWCDQSKNRFRQRVRVILERLLRRFEADEVRPFVTDRHKPLLDAIEKTKKRKKRDRRAGHGDTVAPADGDKKFEDIMFGDEDDEVESEDEDRDDHRRDQPRTAARSRMMESSADNPLDLLDSRQTNHAVTASKAGLKARKRGRDDEEAFAEDKLGKLVIVDSEDEDDGADRDHLMDSDSDSEDERIVSKKQAQSKSKPQAQAQSKQMKGKKENARQGKGGRGNDMPAKRQKTSSILDGSQYKARKASGDVSVRGKKLAPFAYVGLDPKALSHRHKRQTSGAFNGIVAAARKGSQKGQKQARQAANSKRRSRR